MTVAESGQSRRTKMLAAGLLSSLLLLAKGGFCTQALWILCNVPVRLGMTEQSIIDHISSDCKISKFATGEYIFAERRGDTYIWPGSVTISNGKVIGASRDWLVGPEASGPQTAEALYGALSSAGMAGKVITVATNEVRLPDVASRTIRFVRPDREVLVTFGTGLRLSVQEVAGARSLR